jgi:D-alanyl-D-alanine carboxypeptidase
MNRRGFSVCITVVVSLLTFADSSAASASRERTLTKRKAALPMAHPSPSARSRNSKAAKVDSKKGCAPCDAELARGKKSQRAKSRQKMAGRLPCHPKDYVDPRIAKNYRAALRDMKRAGIRPRVTSMWRSSETQAQLHKCSLSTRCRRSNPGLYGALPAGKSIHEAGFAVDIGGIAAGPRGAKRLTPHGKRIVAIMRKNGFNWRYGLADPVHFEADPRKHGYRNVQDAITRTQTTCQVRLARHATNKSHKKATNKSVAARAPVSAHRRLAAQANAPRPRQRDRKSGA